MKPARTLRDIEELLETVDLSTLEVEDPEDLRRIGRAKHAVRDAEAELRAAVAASRASGRSWGYIGIVLGISKQAAQQRFGGSASTAQPM
ncbi:hypothetical protein [Microcella sp.]|uniref:hypothetical protein n=1 Tax=Microcella sp. TaxID=1913979 RepID=UPI00391B10BD